MLPILRGLAGDPAIRGTVLVDYYDSTVSVPEPQDDAATYQHNYDERQKRPLSGTLVEDWLTERLRRHLRSYADGMNPRQSLLRRVFSSNATPQYLVSLPDRSRIADYTRVQMPNFYLARALRNLGDNFEYPFKTSKDNGERARELESRIAALMPRDNTVFLRVTREMRRMADAIRSRGGEVILVRFPVSGYIREADERRYLRAMFWDRFAKDVASPTLNFADVPGLTKRIYVSGWLPSRLPKPQGVYRGLGFSTWPEGASRRQPIDCGAVGMPRSLAQCIAGKWANPRRSVQEALSLTCSHFPDVYSYTHGIATLSTVSSCSTTPWPRGNNRPSSSPWHTAMDHFGGRLFTTRSTSAHKPQAVTTPHEPVATSRRLL